MPGNVVEELDVNPVKDIREYRERALLKFITTGEVEPWTPIITEHFFPLILRGERAVVMIANELASPDVAAYLKSKAGLR